MSFSAQHRSDSERNFELAFQIETFLIKKGANLNQQDIFDRTALHYAFVIPDRIFAHGKHDPIELVSNICAAATEEMPSKLNFF